jgi:hypothetical protein
LPSRCPETGTARPEEEEPWGKEQPYLLDIHCESAYTVQYAFEAAQPLQRSPKEEDGEEEEAEEEGRTLPEVQQWDNKDLQNIEVAVRGS